MRIYNVATGAALDREPVDARELVASGEYSHVNPNAKPGDEPTETTGDVMLRTELGQAAEAKRAHYEQQANQHQAIETPASKAVTHAKEASDAAVAARQAANAMPGNAGLKTAAEAAEKRAADLKAKADKMTADEVVADKALRKQRDDERVAQEKIEARIAKPAPAAPAVPAATAQAQAKP